MISCIYPVDKIASFLTHFLNNFFYNLTCQKKTPPYRKKAAEHMIYETAIKVGSGRIMLWIAIEPSDKGIRGFNISKERNMLFAEKSVYGLVKIMTNIRFPQMVVAHGIPKPAGS
jgi:transposase-like protein